MNNVITSMLEFFGINSVPVDFQTFIFWFCSLLAGVEFCKFCVGSVFNFIKHMLEVSK